MYLLICSQATEIEILVGSLASGLCAAGGFCAGPNYTVHHLVRCLFPRRHNSGSYSSHGIYSATAAQLSFTPTLYHPTLPLQPQRASKFLPTALQPSPSCTRMSRSFDPSWTNLMASTFLRIQLRLLSTSTSLYPMIFACLSQQLLANTILLIHRPQPPPDAPSLSTRSHPQ